MGKNASLKAGIIWKEVPVAQDGDDPLTIFVRGLSPADLTLVMQEDGGTALGLLYSRMTTEATTAEDVLRIATEILHELPDLMAHIIARAADLPDQWEDVRDFAAGAQLELLQAIAQLTFRSDSVGKKLKEIVEKYGREKLSAPLTPTVSKNGSGHSESR